MAKKGQKNAGQDNGQAKEVSAKGSTRATLTLGGTTAVVRAVEKKIQVSIPKVGKPGEGLSALQKAAERLREKKAVEITQQDQLKQSIHDFTSWMKEEAMPFLLAVDKWVQEEGTDYLAEELEPGVTIGQRANEYQQAIRMQAGQEDIVALPVLVTEAVCRLADTNLDRAGLMKILVDLTSQNLLIRDDQNGAILTYFQQRYTISSRFNILKDSEKIELQNELAEAILSQVRGVRERYEAQRLEKIASIRAASEMLPLDILKSNKTGLCAIIQEDGALLVKVTGYVEAVDATGRYENGFSALKTFEAQHPGFRIRVQRDGFSNRGQLADRAPRFPIPQQAAEAGMGRHMMFLWMAIQQAIKEALPKPAQDPNARLDGNQFHNRLFQGRYELGMPQWKWRFPDGEVAMTNLRLEIQRFKDSEEKTRLRITRHSQEHAEILEKAGCLSEEGYLAQELPKFMVNLLKADSRRR